MVDRATEIPDCALTLDLFGDQPTPPQTVIRVICGSCLLVLCGFAALREDFLYLRLRVLRVFVVSIPI